MLDTHLHWKLCVAQNLWVLFKAVCCKTFEFVSFRIAEIIKFEKYNVLQSKNSFYGKVAPTFLAIFIPVVDFCKNNWNPESLMKFNNVCSLYPILFSWWKHRLLNPIYTLKLHRFQPSSDLNTSSFCAAFVSLCTCLNFPMANGFGDQMFRIKNTTWFCLV